MANGYCPCLLRSIEQIAGENAPSRKLAVAGFLAMTLCCQNSLVSPINDAFPGDGTQRCLTVSYSQRPLVSQVQDEDDCDINNIPTKSEWNFPTLRHKQYSFFIPDSEIQKYCSEFSETVAVGTPSTQIMREHYDRFLEAANVVLRAINQDLVTIQSTQFGVNVTTGSNAAKPINIAKTPTINLTDGLIEMARDQQENEICGEVCVVGGGIITGLSLVSQFACCSPGGVDVSKVPFPRVFFDKDTQTIWGANQLGSFAPGSVKFISYNKYLKTYSGDKGNSIFFTIKLPVNEFGCPQDCLNDLLFDVQMKYIDCPTTVTVNGTPQTVNRGWQVIVSKDYALWVMPTNAYQATDPLAGTNGTLRYVVTNT